MWYKWLTPRIIHCVHINISGPFLWRGNSYPLRLLHGWIKIWINFKRTIESADKLNKVYCLFLIYKIKKKKRVHLQSFSSIVLNSSDGDVGCLFQMVLGGCPRDVMVKSDRLQNRCKRVRTPVALFRSLSGKYPWERNELPYPPSYGLNSTTTVLGEWLWH